MLELTLALAFATARPFTCDAIALHDVDGPIHCASGEKIRLQGIGATEPTDRVDQTSHAFAAIRLTNAASWQHG